MAKNATVITGLYLTLPLSNDYSAITVIASSVDAISKWGDVPPLSHWLGTGDTVCRRTAYKKLTKLY